MFLIHFNSFLISADEDDTNWTRGTKKRCLLHNFHSHQVEVTPWWSVSLCLSLQWVVSFRHVLPLASSALSCQKLPVLLFLLMLPLSPHGLHIGLGRARQHSFCPTLLQNLPSGRLGCGGWVVLSPLKSLSLRGRWVLRWCSDVTRYFGTSQYAAECVFVVEHLCYHSNRFNTAHVDQEMHSWCCSCFVGKSVDGCWTVCRAFLQGGMGPWLDAGTLWRPADHATRQTARAPRNDHLQFPTKTCQEQTVRKTHNSW